MKYSTYKYILLIAPFLITFGTTLSAQDSNGNRLEQNIIIHAENVTVTELLNEIGKKANIKFSYNPKLIKATRRVSIHSVNKSVSAVLTTVFADKYNYKIRGNYVIIVQSEATKQENIKNNEILLSGFILDSETNDGVEQASIFTSSGKSTVTDETGAFSLKLEEKDNGVLELRKKGYSGISFETNKKKNTQIEIVMVPEKSISVLLENELSEVKPLVSTEESIIETMYPFNSEIKINEENISDTLYRAATFSIYPGLSTYGNLSGSVVFNFALNFVGYNRGIKGVEIAAFSNINKENVSSVQLAGLSNYVGGNVDGFQASGLFNKVGGKVTGTQLAGIGNYNGGDFKGYQAGGISNRVGGDFKGIQMAGISNHVAGDVVGGQFAGILNQNLGNVEGLQMAGILNLADTIHGSQWAGISNIGDSIVGFQAAGISNNAKDIKGTQIAGIFNWSKNVKGSQISGIFNRAKKISGSQISLFNFADTISGIPIGLFSFVKYNGYKKIDIYADELFLTNIGFSTGVKRFHTGIFAGAQPKILNESDGLFTFGFNVGTTIGIAKGLDFDLNLGSQNIIKKNKWDWENINLKAYTGLDLKLIKNLSLAGGVTFNAFYFDKKLLSDPVFRDIRPSYVYTHDNVDSRFAWRGWMGYKVGLRFSI